MRLQSHIGAYLRKIVFIYSKKRCGVDAFTNILRKMTKHILKVSFLTVFCGVGQQPVLHQHICCFVVSLNHCSRKMRKRLFLHTRHRLPESKLFHCATIFERKGFRL